MAVCTAAADDTILPFFRGRGIVAVAVAVAVPATAHVSVIVERRSCWYTATPDVSIAVSAPG